jgi:hypothetical protein
MSKKDNGITKDELSQLQTYLRSTFSNTTIKVSSRPKKDDSAEVYVGEEFVGVIYVDDEDEDRSFTFQMAILDSDLE